MVSSFFKALFLACALVALPLFAACPKCPKPQPKPKKESVKTYVNPEQISVGSQGIQVKLSDAVVMTPALFVDHEGLFFQEILDKWEPSICPDGQWECSKCHACNANYNLFCQTCWN